VIITTAPRLVERYLIDGYKPQRLSTFALNLFRHRTNIDGEKILIG
jgi:Rab-like protein 2